MATENRGGFRPTAPQNQTRVSHNGGNGSKNGQPTRLAAGGEWGSRAAMATQQGGATMKNAQSPRQAPMSMPTPITAPSQFPDQPITDGAVSGPGSNTLNLPAEKDNSAFNQNIENYAPVLNFIASRESTSSETRKILSILMRGNLTP